jgi:hypothetical protein
MNIDKKKAYSLALALIYIIVIIIVIVFGVDEEKIHKIDYILSLPYIFNITNSTS